MAGAKDEYKARSVSADMANLMQFATTSNRGVATYASASGIR